MTVRVYVQHILRINHEELPRLPPFNPHQSLTVDEIVDIILFGTPKSWQKEMDRQGFDPLEHTVDDIVSFMEQVEATEDHVNSPDKQVVTNKDKKKASTSSKSNGKGAKKFCILHGHGHATDECDQLNAEAKRLKGGDLPEKPKELTQGSFAFSGNKSWSRKAQDAKKKAKKDLAAFIQAEVKKATSATKRKSDDSSNDDEGDLNGFDLADFNYEEMDNLKISGETDC